MVMRCDMDNADGFLTVDEAAHLIGLSHWTVRSWLQKGLLTRYKSAARTVVSRKELLERVEPLPVGRTGVLPQPHVHAALMTARG